MRGRYCVLKLWNYGSYPITLRPPSVSFFACVATPPLPLRVL